MNRAILVSRLKVPTSSTVRADWAPAGESQGPFQLLGLIKITVLRIQPCLNAFLQQCNRLLYSSAKTYIIQ